MVFSNNHNKPSAFISDNRMTLSLPNAMTPVVWIIDLDETGTFVMRVEQDDNGLYVLQKITGSAKSSKVEDIAYYSDRNRAIAAMTLIVDCSAKGEKGPGPVGLKSRILSFFKMIGIVAVSIFLILFLYNVLMGLVPMEQLQSQTAVEQTKTAPTVNNDPNAVGVPMSADDFLKSKNQGLFAF